MPSRRRRLLSRLALACAASAVAVLGLEVAIRLVDGYRVFALRLQPAGVASAAVPRAAEAQVAKFLADPRLATAGLDPAWFGDSPPPVPRRALPAAMAATFRDGYHEMFLYQWNEVLVRATWVPGIGPPTALDVDKPDAFWVFAPVDGQPVPRYRFPTGVTLPTGMTLNAFGCRGRELAADKPARTVRIACVGASTTVDDQTIPHGYPGLLEHFLQRWAAARGLDLKIEVLNAGCEGYTSADIVPTVRHYVLPLAVDYVVYYEGANQLHREQLLRHVAIDGEVPPPPALGGLFDPTAAATRGGWLYRNSAAVRRLHTVGAGEPLAEPPKPAQRLVLPDGLADTVDLARAGEVLGLGDILADLDRIRTDVSAAGARLVLGSFKHFVRDGLVLDPVRGEQVYRLLNEFYWPVSYAHLARLAALQNRWFEAWAAARGVDFLAVAAALPDDGACYTDVVHKTALGSRCHAWVTAALLIPLLERDLRAGTLPVSDDHADPRHPNVPPMRRLTARELDGR
ncbi:MAG: hypothetical protein KDE27_18070 [Planctomycetes bacterium]|nr:hypothetical protein [Planctomycetota bacterium]